MADEYVRIMIDLRLLAAAIAICALMSWGVFVGPEYLQGVAAGAAIIMVAANEFWKHRAEE